MSFLDGYKSKISGVGAILAGVAVVAHAIAQPSIDWSSIWQGALGVIGGLGVLGIGGKLQKLIDTIKESNSPNAGLTASKAQ